jgi:hypothetical protein
LGCLFRIDFRASMSARFEFVGTIIQSVCFSSQVTSMRFEKSVVKETYLLTHEQNVIF